MILIIYFYILSHYYKWIYFLVKYLQMEKNQSLKMFILPQDMGIRNWAKILLASTPLTPFTIIKKIWNKFFAIFFLKCILNLNAFL
jgi:hypothetical protein